MHKHGESLFLFMGGGDMRAWQVISLGRQMIERIVIFVAGCIAVLKLGPILVMALSMLLSIAVYALAFGFEFALGFVLLLFAHELGHVVASRVVGLRTSSPIFIPFLGAVVRIKELPLNVKMEANVAIGGPAMGTLSALFCLTLYLWTNNMLLLILSYTGCLLNLFNLIPCEPLDGGRIAAAISPCLWWLGSIVIGMLFVYTYNVFIFIILVFSLFRLWQKHGLDDNECYYKLTIKQRLSVGWWYFGLIGILGGITWYISQMLQ